MLHSDQDAWPAPYGAQARHHATGADREAIQTLAREIEDMQRRQGDSMAHIVGRLRALEASAARDGGAQTGPASEEPWDAASAEALMQSYEQHDLPGSAALSRKPLGAHEWIGHRFGDVTDRIRRTLTDLKPGTTMALIEERLDQFQRHISSALDDVVRRSDLAGLRLIEEHVADLGEKLTRLEREVARLDGIEADVRSVMDQVSDERIAKVLDANPRFAADLEAVARQAAEEVHARYAKGAQDDARRHDELRALIEASIQDRRAAEADAQSLVSGLSGRISAQADRYDDLKALLIQAHQEQRQSEQTAIGMLDTLQQALVQVLDRIDALEQRPAPPAAWAEAEAPRAAASTFVTASHSSLADDASAQDLAASPSDGRPEPVRDMTGFASHAAPEEAPTLDRMRRDFVAEARRARLKAAANRAEAITSAPPAETDKASALGRTTRAALAQVARLPLAGQGGRVFGASPKLLAGALALIVAINGGILLANRKSTPPAPPLLVQPGLEAPLDTAPDGALPAPETPAGPHSSLPADDMLDFAQDPARASGRAVTPYGLQDDVLDPPAVEPSGGDTSTATVPTGMAIARQPGSMPDDMVANVYEQQVLASLSDKLGTLVAGQSTDALLPDGNGRIDTAYRTEDIPTTAEAEGARAHGLDLPPATVGPLSLRLAAANGDASAEFEVAARLAEGKGTEQNYAEALRWYQRSAGKGFAQAQYRLGTFYERGLGVPQDAERAKVWYGRAAEQGNVKSMHNLAVLAAGSDSGNPDYAAALKWFIQAAEHGLADSQYNLGVLLENGLGTAADKIQAYKWYALAAKSGDADALARRDAIRAAFSADDLKTADRLVVDFKARRAAPLANDARAAGEDWKKRAAEKNG